MAARIMPNAWEAIRLVFIVLPLYLDLEIKYVQAVKALIAQRAVKPESIFSAMESKSF
jgi:hypothetical protein